MPKHNISEDWFRAAEAAGDFMGIRYGRIRQPAREPEWHMVSHCECDGIGGMARLLRAEGADLRQLPESQHPSRGIIKPLWRLLRDRWRHSTENPLPHPAATRAWRTSRQPSSTHIGRHPQSSHQGMGDPQIPQQSQRKHRLVFEPWSLEPGTSDPCRRWVGILPAHCHRAIACRRLRDVQRSPRPRNAGYPRHVFSGGKNAGMGAAHPRSVTPLTPHPAHKPASATTPRGNCQ
jgi:hypothetical protein